MSSRTVQTGEYEWETVIQDEEDGSVYTGLATNPEDSQEIASDKHDKDEADWRPGWW
jgi:hypothetical protein